VLADPMTAGSHQSSSPICPTRRKLAGRSEAIHPDPLTSLPGIPYSRK
jgi:hypothetical protein